jgi:dipeptidase E
LNSAVCTLRFLPSLICHHPFTDNSLNHRLRFGVHYSMSAGAMCWFEAGLTDSFWGAAYRPLDCLGLLPGGCAVHCSSDPKRRETLHAAQQAGNIPSSIAIDDFAAALYVGTSLDSVFSWRSGSTAYQAYREGDKVIETALPIKQIGR